MRHGLAKADAGINRDACARNAKRFKCCHAVAQKARHFQHHISVVSLRLHVARISARHMHQHDRRLVACKEIHRRGIMAQRGHVIDDFSAGFQGGLHGRGMARINADRRCLGQFTHHRNDAGDFLIRENRLRAWAG